MSYLMFFRIGNKEGAKLMSMNRKIAILAAVTALISAPAMAGPAKHRAVGGFDGAYGSTVNPGVGYQPYGGPGNYDRQLVGRLPITTPFGNGY
jgi:hypothetical protein